MDLTQVQKHLQQCLDRWSFVLNNGGIDAFPPFRDSGLIFNVVLDDFISIVPYLRKHHIYYFYSISNNAFRLYQ